MDRTGRRDGWIDNTAARLTRDEDIRSVFRGIMERTIGDAADHVLFCHDAYYAPDGIGRPKKAATIGHWLCLEARLGGDLERDELRSLLSAGTLDDIWKHAASRIEATGYSESIPRLEDDERVVSEFADGFRLVAIERPEAVRNERAYSRVEGEIGEGVTNIVLRNRDGESLAALVEKEGFVTGMAGVGDNLVPYHLTETYLLGYIEDRGLALATPTAIHGAVQISDGRIFDLRDIPDGSVVEGDLWLRKEGRLLSRLPDDMTVNGDFGIFDAPFLRQTPRNLKVSGDAGFVNCRALRTVSTGLSVGGYTHLGTCDNISTIEGDVDFGMSVALSERVERLDARPFKADRVVVGNYGTEDLPRDSSGRVTIPADFVRKALRRQMREELAQLPGLAASVLYSSLATRVRRGVRCVSAALSAEKDSDRNIDPGAGAPRP